MFNQTQTKTDYSHTRLEKSTMKPPYLPVYNQHKKTEKHDSFANKVVEDFKLLNCGN